MAVVWRNQPGQGLVSVGYSCVVTASDHIQEIHCERDEFFYVEPWIQVVDDDIDISDDGEPAAELVAAESVMEVEPSAAEDIAELVATESVMEVEASAAEDIAALVATESVMEVEPSAAADIAAVVATESTMEVEPSEAEDIAALLQIVNRHDDITALLNIVRAWE